MLRVDERPWLKCGIVLSERIGHATVVVTRDMCASPEGSGFECTFDRLMLRV